MDAYTQILVILFSPLFTIGLFQLSSVLNQTLLDTGISMSEIEDIEELTGISHKRIRMFSKKRDKTLFRIFDENNTQEIANIIFDIENNRLISQNNIQIDPNKLLELRKKKFAKLIKVSPDELTISDDGNTFTQYHIYDSGEKRQVGSITIGDNNEPISGSGILKKFV